MYLFIIHCNEKKLSKFVHRIDIFIIFAQFFEIMAKRKQPKQLDLFSSSFDGTFTDNHCIDCRHRFLYGRVVVCSVHGKSTNNHDSC